MHRVTVEDVAEQLADANDAPLVALSR